MTTADYVETYPPRLPGRPHQNEDELRLLGAVDGVQRLGAAPAGNSISARPEKTGDPGSHLWVIDEVGIPYILERASISPPLQSGVVKHTNLTGGEAASCGGELWFETPRALRLYVNGCSGRYGPKTPAALDDAISVFTSLGYEVVSFGWDEGADKPHMVLHES